MDTLRRGALDPSEMWAAFHILALLWYIYQTQCKYMEGDLGVKPIFLSELLDRKC